MKIDVNNAYRIYSQNAAGGKNSRPGANDKLPTGSQDRVSISNSAYKNDVDRLVYSTAAEVEAKVSPSRLNELREAIADGSYSVHAEKLADAILDSYV